MAINRGNFGLALEPGMKAWYNEARGQHPAEWSKVFDKMTSRRAYEEITGVSGTGLAVIKPEGDSVTYDTMQQGFRTRFTHLEYGIGVIITRNMVEDDLYDIVGKQRAMSLGMSVDQTYENVAWNVLNRAFNNSYVGGDGLEMCSTAHLNAAGGTYANELTTAADLSEASLEQAIIDIGKLKNDRGLQVPIRPKQLVIPVDLEFEATRILKSAGRVSTADNDLNALNSLSKIPGGIVVSHYLTDTDAWFVTTDAPEGLILFERRGPEMGMDNEFDTDNAKYKATFRISAGWANPRGIFGSPGV